MHELTKEKKTVFDWVAENEKKMSDFHQKIWHYAEPAFREYKGARLYVEILRKEGFDVEEGSGEMPTAFCATFGEGKPVIATYAEYDATPGNSQQAVPYEAPREGTHKWAAGHTDPHSALGVGALAGILAAKEAMVKYGLKGTLKFFGEPAEKVCGSKPVHAAKGYFDDMDAAISWHPTWAPMGSTTLWDTQCGSYWSVVFNFECLEPETWVSKDLMLDPGNAHVSPRCPGALDAVTMMYTNTKVTKEAMFPHTGTWAMNEYIMTGGQCTSDNLAPRFSQIQYSWRAPTLALQRQLLKVLENNAKHVAAICHCEVSMRWVAKTRVGLTNHAMADMVYKNLELAGPPVFSDEAVKFGQEIQKNVGIEPMDDPIAELSRKLTPPKEFEEQKRQVLPPWQKNYTSDDYVDYTWHAPTARMMVDRCHLKSPETGFVYPAWAYNATGGIRSMIDPCIMTAGKVIGASIIELLTNPDELKKAKAEFNERTGGGVGGSKWVAPLLPSDFKPPVNLKWPEYINTVRGEEWYLPTSE